MAEFPALPLWTDALIGDTHHLTPAEFGAYLRLLVAAWRTPDCTLPDDDNFLGRAVGDPRGWHRLKPVVMAFWVKNSLGTWYQKRLSYERKKLLTYKARAAAGGRGKSRKTKDTSPAKDTASDVLNACETPASEVLNACNPNPNPSNPLTPASGGSEASQVEDEGEDENFYRRPLRANGTNPRALQEADESAERRRRASVRVKQWDDRLTQFETTGRWDTAWGPEPPITAGFSPQGVLLPKPLWPRYQEISQRRIA